ncbi:MAG: UDP-diphosphatase [Candidatus Rokubacteria bacterium 13_2_20CM_2_64_8]|nr:MAG: UDP-diphosphatase [Candidatus Rokubacteria bacterium 13_2_20CM_2_64_8]OLD30053.1 MAG: UDP-diphosphatase [Candidatus Rokubacteria bacterium 13_1_40CM_2_68_13]PYN63325.1 MAG: UDP-diphosphatase [Candidatus Rokubacteria bacterium]
MNDYVLAVVLGVIEGLTEFLPVSSTAHLRLTEALLGIDLGDPYWKTFSIVIQLGAILCLPIYFWGRLVKLVRFFPHGSRGDRTVATHPLSLTLIAFLTTAIPAFLLTKIIGKHLESLFVMAASLIVGGVVMWVVDAIYERSQGQAFARGFITETMEEMSVGQAVWIGACQLLSAVFPGTSRSMATITAGELAGMTRSVALEFSFFLSIPTMAAATLYDLLKSLRPRAGEPSAIGAMPHDAHSFIVLAVGFVVSFVVAYAVVGWFLGWVRRRGLTPFAAYRIVLGAAVLLWAIRSG